MTTPHDAEGEAREFMRLATRRTGQSAVAHLRSYAQYIGVQKLEPPNGWLAARFVEDVEAAIAEDHAAVYARAMRDAVGVDVDDAMILAVEEHVGMGSGAWDMVKASEIIRGSIIAVSARLAALPATPSREGATDGR